MEENKQLTDIDNYILKRMSEEEVIDFEKKMNEDKGLSAEVDIQIKLIESLKEKKKKDDFFLMLNEINKKVGAQKEKINPPITKVIPIQRNRARYLKPLLAIAASIAFLLALLWFLDVPSIDAPQLAKQNLTPSKDIFSVYFESSGYTEGTNETYEGILKAAMADFEAEDYKNAEEKLLSYKEKVGENDKSIFRYLTTLYLAQIAILDENKPRYEEGMELLKPIADARLPFKNYINWYLALSYLGNKDIDKAKESLRKIPENDKEFGEKAKELLEEITRKSSIKSFLE